MCERGADENEMASKRMYGSREGEIRDPWVLGEMTERRPSARDHTLALTLELLRSVSFAEHRRQCLW